ncbi:hypothetical protein [Brevibacillus laterosporus]|nr:hypothetical protein [Brevibacillus laterosporus]MCG7319783.1 hypothetical protein [Brevibacillus laterosporus]
MSHVMGSVPLEVRSLIERGEKAGAIKLVQDKLKLTTQEAKHYIELL